MTNLMKRIPFFKFALSTAYILAVLFVLFGISKPAEACWTPVLTECFDRLATQWPWQNPTGSGRQWRYFPAIPQPHWAPQSDFYSINNCEFDQHSAWCIGYPTSNDPEFDFYSPNLNTYMTYGPINLANAVNARVLFELLNRSEVAHDSIFWGAATAFQLTAQNMQVGGSFWGNSANDEFQYEIIDLTNLRNYTTGDSVSMIGQNTVYIFWRFVADANANVNSGAFVDNVVIAYDDGAVDLISYDVEVLRTDTMVLGRPPETGDSLLVRYRFQSCDGAADPYAPFHVIGRLDDQLLLDTTISGLMPNTQVELYTNTFYIDGTPGTHVIRFFTDSLNQITESNENNNTNEFSYFIQVPNIPPTFTWVTPGTDTLNTEGQSATLRWIVNDPDDIANVNIYYDLNPEGCTGPGISLNRTENDGPDSCNWNTTALQTGRLYYPFARIVDAEHDTCVYSPFPACIRCVPNDVDPVGGILPQQFYLEQNYPNPFNPVTEIRYGVSGNGLVSLKVYDILGRETITLVDENLSPGNYQVEFDGTLHSAGLYLYTLTTPEGSISRKMMLLK